MSRKLFERGQIVTIVNVDARQAAFGFAVGQSYKVWVDYEDLIYLDSHVKGQTANDFFYPEQIEIGGSGDSVPKDFRPKTFLDKIFNG